MAIGLLVYRLFLEKEKMHCFNRWYLMASVILSFIIPLVVLPVASSPLPVLDDSYFIILNNNEVHAPITPATGSINSQSSATTPLPVVLIIYSIVTAILLFRYIWNLLLLAKRIHQNRVIIYRHAKLVLLKEKMISHTFLNYIFVNEDDYNNGLIENEILTHELTHVRQKHSVDILFVELLLVSCWFNPLLILYKRSIRLNHEFLADEAVIKSCVDVHSYQYLLLEKISLLSNASFASSFNFSVTKKRLKMMTKITTHTMTIAKQLLVIPVLASVVFIFSTRIIAQTQPSVLDKVIPDTIPKKNLLSDELPPYLFGKSRLSFSKEGISQQSMEEYNTIIKKNMTKTKNNYDRMGIPSEEERKKLETIFLHMSKTQQERARVIFIKRLGPLDKGSPTEKEFQSWKNAATYGVWINEKKVSNETLNKYTAADFDQFFVSKLYPAARIHVKYFFQVDLMTKTYYADYVKREQSLPKNEMLYRFDKRGAFYIN